MTKHHYLLATLGGKPQVIITALDKLKEQQPITHLILFHTAQGSARIEAALQRVQAEVTASNYYQPPVQFEPVPLIGPQGQLSDVVTPADINSGFRTIYQTMLDCKRRGGRIHFCPAGGRKTMTLFGMAAAQLLFEEGDLFWHVVAEGDFLASGRLHPGPDDEAQLVNVPLLRWLNVTPALLHEKMGSDPYWALQHSQQMLQQVQDQRKQDFLTHWLTPAERQAALLIIQEGLSNQSVGKRLGRSSITVANQLTGVYKKLADFLQLDQGETANRHMLIATFAAYVAQESRSAWHT